jgi:hypothetical protein
VARQSNAFSPHPGFQFCDERRDARLAHRQTLGCRVAIDRKRDAVPVLRELRAEG